MNSKLKTVFKRLVMDPSGLWKAVGHKMRLKLARRNLRRRLDREGTRVIWVDHGWGKLPFFGDGDDQEILYYVYGDEWYRNELETLRPWVPRGGVALDIGANIGFITTILSDLVGPEGHVHSFEPSPSVNAKLQATVAKNDLRNVTIHQVACGEKPGTFVLVSPSESSGNATLVAGGEVNGKQEQVRVVRLQDHLSSQGARIDFVKIDTEGFEDQVLAGAEELVDRFRPTFYIELSQEYRESSLAAIRWLKTHGYHFPIEPDLDSSRNGDNFIAIFGDRASS